MIDVVLATHNGERYLPVLLRSLSEQSTPPARLVVVDDCSTDTTPELLRRFAEDAAFDVTLISAADHLGSAAAFARGVSVARSPVVAFCDQDDRWRPHKLQRVRELCEEADDAAMVVSDVDLTDDRLEPLGRTFWQSIDFRPPTRGAARQEVFASLMRGGRVPGMAIVMQRDLALLAGPPGRGWHHDGWYSLIAAALGRICFIPDALVDYRLHPGQQTAPGVRPPRRLPRSERAQRFSSGAARFVELTNRLEELQADEWAIEMARDKSRFLAERASMALAPAQRPVRILSNLRRGEYARYATVRSALADLVGAARPRPYVG